MKVDRIVWILLVMAAFVAPVFAQGVSVESKTRPSVVGAGPFVSLEGRFSIALPPAPHGFRPLAVDSAAGKLTGDAYDWKMKEGSFTVGFVDSPQSMEDAETTARIFGSLRAGMPAWANSKNGKLTSDKQIEFDKHPGLELTIEFPEAVLRQRFYIFGSRLFQLVLVVSTEQHPDEALAMKVLDSFKVLSETEVSAALKAKAAAAEPASLPQEPVAARVGTDAADDGLRSAVKTIFKEEEDLRRGTPEPGKKPRSMTNFNQIGNRTKVEDYDYKGNVSGITLYGYIDGARVSKTGTIEREYDPPLSVTTSSPVKAPKKSDPRYDYKFIYRYDDQKRLVEVTWIQSNGVTTNRFVYKYSDNQREELSYSLDGSLSERVITIFDEKGNELESTAFFGSGSLRGKYSYAYEFDARGNWVKQVTSKLVTKDGTSALVPEYATYRTITYYDK